VEPLNDGAAGLSGGVEHPAWHQPAQAGTTEPWRWVMTTWFRYGFLVLTVAVCTSSVVAAQEEQAATPERLIVSLYHIAPGQHREFVQWMGRLDMMNQEVGIPATQVYVHDEGDSWDYLLIRAVPTPEQEEKLEALAKQRGLHSAVEQHFQVRKYILSHTDTYVYGPMALSQFDKIAEQGGVFR
jgi:hypothetical protein